MSGLASSRRPAGCPPDLALDELRAGDLGGSPREATLRRHLEGCSACQARFAGASSLGAPPLSPQLRAAAAFYGGPPRPLRRLAGGGAVGVAAAAMVALVVVWRQDPRDERRAAHRDEPNRGEPDRAERNRAERNRAERNRTKGALTLTVLIKRADGQVDRIAGEGPLRPGEEMTFAVQAAQAGRVMVVGLDAAPAATVYVPFEATGAAVQVDDSRPTALPGSIVADARTGAERVFAVLCPEGVTLLAGTLRVQAEAALARAGGRPEAVVSLDTPCAQASVLLHKAPRAP